MPGAKTQKLRLALPMRYAIEMGLMPPPQRGDISSAILSRPSSPAPMLSYCSCPSHAERPSFTSLEGRRLA